MNYNVGVIAGDGIGPEIVSEARKGVRCHWSKIRTHLYI